MDPQNNTDITRTHHTMQGGIDIFTHGGREHLIVFFQEIKEIPLSIIKAIQILYSDTTNTGWTMSFMMYYIFIFIAVYVISIRMAFIFSGEKQFTELLDKKTISNRFMVQIRYLFFLSVSLLIFSAGNIAFLITLESPRTVRSIVYSAILISVIMKGTAAVGHLVLAPNAPLLRLLPMPTSAARHWYITLLLTTAFLSGGYIFSSLLLELEQPLNTATALRCLTEIMAEITVALGFIVATARFRLPTSKTTTLVTLAVLSSSALIALGHSQYARILDLAWEVPSMIWAWRTGVRSIFRPESSPADDQTNQSPHHNLSLLTIVVGSIIERAGGGLMLIHGVISGASAWGVSWSQILIGSPRAETSSSVARALFVASVAVLLVDIVRHLSKAIINHQAHTAAVDVSSIDKETYARLARLRTIAPVINNISIAVISTFGLLSALSTLGINIAPLLAGAGVVGIALGFGAQRLVQDILGGLFFLAEDAFRVDEYIQSGAMRGTVERIQIRSIRLRHHRGALNTVPFSELKSIINLSRDWAILKLEISIALGADFEAVRTVVKKVGKEMLEDPELAREILEPLKSQGIQGFVDGQMMIRLKIKCRPAEQFLIRREAYHRVKLAFDKAGIGFATPVVQVAQGPEEVELATVAATQTIQARATGLANTASPRI